MVGENAQGSFEFEDGFAETAIFLEGAREVESERDIVGMQGGEPLECVGCFAELLVCK